MFAALGADGAAVINADDRFAAFWRGSRARPARRHLRHARARPTSRRRDVRASARRTRLRHRLRAARAAGRPPRRDCALAGEHNVMNALRAAAAAAAAGAGARRRSCAGLAAMRPVAGRLQLRARAERRAARSTTPTTPIPARCARASTSLAALPGERWLVLGDMARARRRLARGCTRRSARSRASSGVDAPVRHRRRGAARGRGLRRGRPVVRRRRRPDRRARGPGLTRGRDGAGQGLALEPARARRRRAGRRTAAPRAGEATSMLRHARRVADPVLLGLQRLHLPDAARDPRGAHGARDLAAWSGPAMIRRLAEHQVGQRVRDDGPQSAPVEGRHADHGRRADPGRDRRGHAALGRPRATASSGSCSASRWPSA